MKCACGTYIEEDRLRVLPNTKLCASCAMRLASRGQDVPRPKGIMVYDHKTAPTIQIISEETYRDYKSATYRRGAGSVCRKFAPNFGAPQ